MYKTLLIFATVLSFLTACHDTIDEVQESTKPGGFVVMDAATGDIPYPNDILFAPNNTSTNDPGDGTLNIPYEPSDADAGIKMALDTLSGFSTTAPITVSVTADMDNTTLSGNVRLFKAVGQASQATNYIPAIGIITDELTFGEDFVAQVAHGKLAIIPTKPLDANTTYVVVLTNGIKNTKGQSLSADAVTSMINGIQPLTDATGTPTAYFNANAIVNAVTAQTLEGLRQLNQARLAALMTQSGMNCSVLQNNGNTGVSCPDVIMSWNFTTQNIGTMTTAFAQNNPSGAIAVANTGQNTASVGAYGMADIYAGVLSGVPYYLGTPTAENPTAPLTQSFIDANGSAIVNTLPTLQSTQTIPLLMSIPNTTSGVTMPETGWPVVIFQHGITQNRTNLLALADAFAQAGYAAVAIDLPLHGLDSNTSGLKTNFERTFDLDYDQDGTPDASGAYYMNLRYLLVTRDNIRQSTSDLITLYNSLSNVTGATIDASRIAFVGHSLGTIASFGFFDANKTLESVTLAMPGGGIAQLMSHSPAFGSEIRDGLASAGIAPDSAEYEAFLLAAQTVLDDADSINYAKQVASKNTYFAIEVVGDGSEGSGDQTISNRIPTAPLSGTDPLLDMMGMSDINTSSVQTVGVNGNTVSRFLVGAHNSFLLPDIATYEMQTETASFVGSQAQAITIGDNSLLVP